MTQPKDMEQLKSEARIMAERYEYNHYRLSGGDLDTIIEKSHLSGRESMRVECVERAEQSFPTFGKDLASALKKIKL